MLKHLTTRRFENSINLEKIKPNFFNPANRLFISWISCFIIEIVSLFPVIIYYDIIYSKEETIYLNIEGDKLWLEMLV